MPNYKITYKLVNDNDLLTAEQRSVVGAGDAKNIFLSKNPDAIVKKVEEINDLPSWGNSYIGKAAKFGAGKISNKIEERNNRTPEEIAYKAEQNRLAQEKLDAENAEFFRNAGSFLKKYWWTVIIAVGLIYGLIYLNKHKTKSSETSVTTNDIVEPTTNNVVPPANSENNSQEETTEETHNLATNDANGFSTLEISNIKGEYVGNFGKDELTINIEDLDLDGGNVTGYDLVKENKRVLKGSATKTNNPEEIKLKLSEPGDDKWDGVFDFVLNIENNVINGSWKSNNGKSTKEFTLNKK